MFKVLPGTRYELFHMIRSHRHRHVGPAPLADLSARAARTDIIIIRQVNVKHQFALYRLKRPWLHREVVLARSKRGGEGRECKPARVGGVSRLLMVPIVPMVTMVTMVRWHGQHPGNAPSNNKSMPLGLQNSVSRNSENRTRCYGADLLPYRLALYTSKILKLHQGRVMNETNKVS